MNNKGFAPLLNIMIALVLFILALALAGPLRSVLDDIRGPTTTTGQGLDCANTSISDFDKGGCLAVDLILPSFIGFIFAMAGIIIGARIIFG